MRTTLMTTMAFALLVGCGSGESSIAQSTGDDDGGDGSGDCTFTQGFWKNHEEAWPVSSLELGSVSYTQQELLAIFGEPVRGNGLISLAHQLIAAKLNVAFGANDWGIADEIAAADAMIGALVVPPVGSGYLAPRDTGSLNDALDGFNNTRGDTCGPGPSCGDGVIDAGEQCDDGNTTSGDGCSSSCQDEPRCGNGTLDAGEQCDDGNTTDGDGCSASCTDEPKPCCGDGVIDAGEQCDDGNTTSGDGCSSTCQNECGNGKLDAGEQCDDGNTTGGDGCSSTCQCEPV